MAGRESPGDGRGHGERLETDGRAELGDDAGEIVGRRAAGPGPGFIEGCVGDVLAVGALHQDLEDGVVAALPCLGQALTWGGDGDGLSVG